MRGQSIGLRCEGGGGSPSVSDSTPHAEGRGKRAICRRRSLSRTSPRAPGPLTSRISQDLSNRSAHDSATPLGRLPHRLVPPALRIGGTDSGLRTVFGRRRGLPGRRGDDREDSGGGPPTLAAREHVLLPHGRPGGAAHQLGRHGASPTLGPLRDGADRAHGDRAPAVHGVRRELGQRIRLAPHDGAGLYTTGGVPDRPHARNRWEAAPPGRDRGRAHPPGPTAAAGQAPWARRHEHAAGRSGPAPLRPRYAAPDRRGAARARRGRDRPAARSGCLLLAAVPATSPEPGGAHRGREARLLRARGSGGGARVQQRMARRGPWLRATRSEGRPLGSRRDARLGACHRHQSRALQPDVSGSSPATSRSRSRSRSAIGTEPVRRRRTT